MTEVIIIFLSVLGSLVSLVAAIGVLRMPDFYLRLSVTVKASTVGAGLLLVAAALYFSVPDVTNRALAIVLFLILTAPVAGQMIARAAYMQKTKQWENSKIDEMEGMFDEETHEIFSDKEQILKKKCDDETAENLGHS